MPDDVLMHSKIARAGTSPAPTNVLLPAAEELAVLSSFARFAFRCTHRMNLGSWQRLWTWCQSVFRAGWSHFSTSNLICVYGLENIKAVDRDRLIPLAD